MESGTDFMLADPVHSELLKRTICYQRCDSSGLPVLEFFIVEIRLLRCRLGERRPLPIRQHPTLRAHDIAVTI